LKRQWFSWPPPWELLSIRQKTKSVHLKLSEIKSEFHALSACDGAKFWNMAHKAETGRSLKDANIRGFLSWMGYPLLTLGEADVEREARLVIRAPHT
jgi:hypothetical protein